MTEVGHIHGRFQPFHDKHADYALWAADQCDHLIIGITNADPSHIEAEEAEPKRHKAEHNPFKYHERYKMIRAYVEASPLDNNTSIMPFPINRPDLWDEYAPEDIVHYVRTLEEWHDVKTERFRSHGRKVVAQQVPRVLSGEEIRDRMAAGEPWKHTVPEPVAEYIDMIDGPNRLANLYEEVH